MASITVIQSPTLSSTNIAGSTYPEWSGVSSYTEGDRVKVSTASDGTSPIFPIREYQANGPTAGSYPPTAMVDEWVEVGAQNAHAMFDLLSDQRTAAPELGTIEVSLTTTNNDFNRIALLGLSQTDTISVEIVSEGETVYTATANTLDYITPVGWWTYLFRSDEFAYRRTVAFDMPNRYRSPTINITLSGASPACGWCMLGKKFTLADTEWEAEANPKDYSEFKTNQFGVTTLVPRRVVDDVRGTLWVDTEQYNRVYSILRGNMNTLALYDLNNDNGAVYDSLIAYGKLESVSGGLAYGKTPISIKISGLT